jgi:hypothetical protein
MFDVSSGHLDAGGGGDGAVTTEQPLYSPLAAAVFSGIAIPMEAVMHIRQAVQEGRLPEHCDWEGFIADGAMFLRVPEHTSWAANEFRECVLAVMDLAERLSCEQLIICLEKDRADTADLVCTLGLK